MVGVANPFFSHCYDGRFGPGFVALANGLEFFFNADWWVFTKEFFDLILKFFQHHPILITSTELVVLFWKVVQEFLPYVLTNQDVTEFCML